MGVSYGSAYAIYQLGRLHASGWKENNTEIPPNLPEASRLFKQAADLGYSIAQMRYAKHLMKMTGPTNLLLAKDYLEKAVAQGNAIAEYELAGLLKDTSPTTARSLLKRAADKGLPPALNEYGLLMTQGWTANNGETALPNIPLGLKYFFRAAQQGYVGGMFNYAQFTLIITPANISRTFQYF